MLDLLLLVLAALRTACCRRGDLVLENLLLRHQLALLARPTRQRRRVRFRRADKLLWVLVRSLRRDWRRHLVVVTADTVVRWHRAGWACIGVRDVVCGWYGPRVMPPCSACERPSTKRHGRDDAGRQRFMCRPCRRTFTAHSTAAVSGYRWPPEVILTAVRWYLAHPLSATSVQPPWSSPSPPRAARPPATTDNVANSIDPQTRVL